MDMFDVIRKRQSVRKYSSRSVEKEKLEQILEAARSAPSAKNRQARKFVVVQEPDLRKQLIAAARGQKHVGDAPVVIACCGLDPGYFMTCGQPADVIDVAIAIDHMTLAAAALGLGTCWIGAFYQDQVKKLLNIPDSVQVVELMTLGYAAGTESKKSRKPLDTMVCNEKWDD